MTAAFLIAGYGLFVVLVLAAFRARARANDRRDSPSLRLEIDLPMTPDQERELYRAYRQTAALQPGGRIASRRA